MKSAFGQVVALRRISARYDKGMGAGAARSMPISGLVFNLA
jgi:hypothetical protein